MSPNTLKLLGIVALLLTVQWVVLPWLSWQNEQVIALEKKLQRLSERSDVIRSGTRLENERAQLSTSLEALAVLSAPNHDGIELPLQQLIVARLSDYKLELESFEWGEAGTDDVIPLRARITIAGGREDFIDWQNSLLQSQPWMEVEEFNLRRLNPQWFEMSEVTGDVVIRVIVGGES